MRHFLYLSPRNFSIKLKWTTTFSYMCLVKLYNILFLWSFANTLRWVRSNVEPEFTVICVLFVKYRPAKCCCWCQYIWTLPLMEIYHHNLHLQKISLNLHYHSSFVLLCYKETKYYYELLSLNNLHFDANFFVRNCCWKFNLAYILEFVTYSLQKHYCIISRTL